MLIQTGPQAKRWQISWGYFQHELLYLTWLCMEAALFTPLLVILLRWIRLWPAGALLVWLLLLMVLPLNLARLMGVLTISQSRQQLTLALTFFLTYLLTVRTLFYQPSALFDLFWLGQFVRNLADFSNVLWLRDSGWFLVMALAWWRGLRLAGREFTVSSAGLRLRLGGLVLIPLLIWWSLGRLPWSLVPLIGLFFLAALTAVSLSRAEEIEKSRSGRSVSLNPRWLLSVTVAAGLVLGTAVLLTLIVSGQTALLLVGWLAPLWLALYSGGAVILNTILILISPLLFVLSWLAQQIALFLVWLMNRFGGIVELPTLRVDPAAVTPEAARELITNPAAAGGSKLIAILLMIAVALAVSLALGRVYRQAKLAAQEGEPAAASAAQAAPQGNFRARLQQRWERLRGWRTAASVRRIYQNMCQAAAASGYARQAAQTPFEYQTTLNRAWPDNQADARLITEAYVKIRYGELPETENDLELLRQAWSRLEVNRPSAEPKQQKISYEIDPRTPDRERHS